MSEAHTHFIAYFSDEPLEGAFLQGLGKVGNTIDIDDEFVVKDVNFDRIISGTFFSGLYVNFDKIKSWFLRFNPDVLMLAFDSECGSQSFFSVDGKRSSKKVALDRLSHISRDIQLYLYIVSRRNEDAWSLISEQSVNLSHTVFGLSHFDRIASSGNVELLKKYLFQGGDPNHVVMVDPYSSRVSPTGSHLIHFIAKTEDWELLELALERGCDPDGMDLEGLTLLNRASIPYDIPEAVGVVRLLIDKGADVNRCPSGEIRDSPIFSVATFAGYVEDVGGEQSSLLLDMVNLLVDSGADPYVYDQRGVGILWYVGHIDSISRCLKERFPSLLPYKSGVSKEVLIQLKYNQEPDSVDYYRFCLAEGFYSELLNQQAIDACKSSSEQEVRDLVTDCISHDFHDAIVFFLENDVPVFVEWGDYDEFGKCDSIQIAKAKGSDKVYAILKDLDPATLPRITLRIDGLPVYASG